MVRAIYLLQISDRSERLRLMESTLNNEPWTKPTKNGKMAKITDRDMVELAATLQGWTLSVYKFGCAFIHLSNLCDYHTTDPFIALSQTEQNDILTHLRYYHGGPHGSFIQFNDIILYLPLIHTKIRDSLMCNIGDLEKEKGLPP